ncbi:hypothetical protein [Streptomyces sp. CB02923]|uniref:hypothetical protein n=1 Tax=Streptomyces sp. CB02923 TaxID=1718985 RepID=UPI001901DEF8|nr:hypothetical protein [Streptomyces sp. CB02923]
MEHVIDRNWSRLRQSVIEGEAELAGDAPSVLLDELLDQSNAADLASGPQPDAVYDERAGKGGAEMTLGVPVAALGRQIDRMARAAGALGRVAGDATGLTRARTAEQSAERSAPDPLDGPGVTQPVRTVRIGDLSGRLIEEAGEAGRTLVLTHDRAVIGIVVPVTRQLVEFLIEQNMSRVLYNIDLGEKDVEQGEPFTTLEEVMSARGRPGT